MKGRHVILVCVCVCSKSLCNYTCTRHFSNTITKYNESSTIMDPNGKHFTRKIFPNSFVSREQYAKNLCQLTLLTSGYDVKYLHMRRVFSYMVFWSYNLPRI